MRRKRRPQQHLPEVHARVKAMPLRCGDDELMAHLAAGDLEAMDELVGRYGAPLYGFIMAQIGRPEAAQDLLQDVFVGVFEARLRYAARGQFRAWLYQIVVRPAAAGPAAQPAPAAEGAYSFFRLAEAAGAIRYRRAGNTRWFKVPPGTLLASGDALDTRSGLATLVSENVQPGAGGGRLFCNRHTLIRVGDKPGELLVRSGEVYCEGGAGTRFVIRTPLGEAEEAGTKFSVKVTPTGTIVTVAEGKVLVRNDKGSVEVTGASRQPSVKAVRRASRHAWTRPSNWRV